MPTTLNTTHTISANAMGVAIRAFAGIWNVGMISVIFVRKMNKNSVTSRGVHTSPSRPIVSMTMPSSMNSIDDSATLRTPVGATMGSRLLATQNNAAVTITARTLMTAILLKLGKMSGQTSSSLISGNSRAKTFTATTVLGLWLQSGKGERRGNVLGLPEQEPEVGHDDREAEGHERHPRGVLRQP